MYQNLFLSRSTLRMLRATSSSWRKKRPPKLRWI